MDPNAVAVEDILQNIARLQKGFISREERHVLRVLRTLPALRKKLNPAVLAKILSVSFKGNELEALQKFVPSSSMDTSADIAVAPSSLKIDVSVEAQNYVVMLLIVFSIDNKRYSEAATLADELYVRIRDNKHLASEQLTAKFFFYYQRAHELNDSIKNIHGFLHAGLRTASLRNDFPSQAVLINALLRGYIHDNLIEQADLLVSRATFPENASSSEGARYLYYLGRIKALQLEYTEAHRHLDLAVRKAPRTAYGFHQTVHKLKTIVQMLLGEIPERALFRIKYLRGPLQPYYELTQAVRVGDVARFSAVVKEHAQVFQTDKTYTLILRLRHNVIKTGIRLICLSYHRISLVDVASKLQLDSAEDAQYIVAKAIHDGVIDAEINVAEGFMQSKELVDVYGTNEPQDAFHQRIQFCLKMHNDAVKALQFPPNAYRKYLETPEQRRERERQEEELQEELEKEGDLDDF